MANNSQLNPLARPFWPRALGTRANLDIKEEINEWIEEEAKAKAKKKEEAKAKAEQEASKMIDQLKPLLEHEGTKELMSQLGVSMFDFYKHVFISDLPYDSICIASPGWKDKEVIKDYGKFYTSKDFFMLFYSYILKRGAAVIQLEAERYTWMHRCWTSRHNDAMKVLMSRLIFVPEKGPVSTKQGLNILNLPKHGRTVMLDDQIARGAHRVFTEEPLKMMVMTWHKRVYKEQEWAIVHFKDVEEPKGSWETDIEIMSATLGNLLHPRHKYEFRPGEHWLL